MSDLQLIVIGTWVVESPTSFSNVRSQPRALKWSNRSESHDLWIRSDVAAALSSLSLSFCSLRLALNDAAALQKNKATRLPFKLQLSCFVHTHSVSRVYPTAGSVVSSRKMHPKPMKGWISNMFRMASPLLSARLSQLLQVLLVTIRGVEPGRVLGISQLIR